MVYFKTKKEAVAQANKYLGKPGYYITIRKVKGGRPWKLIIGRYGPVKNPQKEIIFL